MEELGVQEELLVAAGYFKKRPNFQRCYGNTAYHQRGTEVSSDNACAPFLWQSFKRVGTQDGSCELFKREERPKKNAKSGGFSFLQF